MCIYIYIHSKCLYIQQTYLVNICFGLPRKNSDILRLYLYHIRFFCKGHPRVCPYILTFLTNKYIPPTTNITNMFSEQKRWLEDYVPIEMVPF